MRHPMVSGCGGGSGGWGGDCASLLGAVAQCTDSQSHLPQKSSTCRSQGGGAWCKWLRPQVSVLGCLLKSVYTEGWGREMDPDRSFILGEGILHLPLSGKPPQKSKRSPLMCLRCPCLCPRRLPTQQCSAPWPLPQAGWLSFKSPSFRNPAWRGPVLVLWVMASPHWE